MTFELHGVEMTSPDGSPICDNFGNPWHEPVARFMGEGYTPLPQRKQGTPGNNQQLYLDMLRRLHSEEKERRPDPQCWVTDKRWRNGLRGNVEYHAKHFTRTVKALVNSGHVRNVGVPRGRRSVLSLYDTPSPNLYPNTPTLRGLGLGLGGVCVWGFRGCLGCVWRIGWGIRWRMPPARCSDPMRVVPERTG